MAKILTSSDCSFCVEFGNAISEEINNQVRSFTVAAEAAQIEGVTELVPTYRSVTVHYRPEVIGYARLYEKLNKIVNGLQAAQIPPAGEIRVPVLYGGKHGPDLENVAKLHDMTPEEVIQLHTAPTYLNYMLGFLPGFCYLGGLDERIHTPRLTTPRVKIPAGHRRFPDGHLPPDLPRWLAAHRPDASAALRSQAGEGHFGGRGHEHDLLSHRRSGIRAHPSGELSRGIRRGR